MGVQCVTVFAYLSVSSAKVNPDGTLIYEREFVKSQLTSNEKIRIASTFYGLSSIAAQASLEFEATVRGGLFGTRC